VKQAGGGDVESATTDSIEQWFRQHLDIAQHIRPLCDAAQRKAPASWGDTTEGRVCEAVSRASFFAPAVAEPDKNKF
jgi:hypothetical protein